MLNVQELVVCLRPPEGGGPELTTAHRQEMWQEPRVEDKGAKYPEDGQEGVGQACGHPGAPGRVVRSEWAMMSWNKSSAETADLFTAQAGGSWQQGLEGGEGGSC